MTRAKRFLAEMAKEVTYDDVEKVCGKGYGSVIYYIQSFEVWLERERLLARDPADAEKADKAEDAYGVEKRCINCGNFEACRAVENRDCVEQSHWTPRKPAAPGKEQE